MILKVKMMQNKREKHTLAAQTSESLDQLIDRIVNGKTTDRNANKL